MKVASILIVSTLIIGVLGDLPSCSRARCSHCEADLIARLCPQACSSCPVSALRADIPPKATVLGPKPVAHGLPTINSAHGELHPLPQAPGASPPQPVPIYQQPPPPQPQHQFQPQPQQPYYPQQPQGFNFNQPQPQQPSVFGPQQPYQGFPQPAAPTQFGQSPFFNPFQPFLTQTYQAQTPFNPFAFPTFAPVTFAPQPVVTPAPVTAPPPVPQPTAPQLPRFQPPPPQVPQQPYPQPPQSNRVEAGSNNQPGYYQQQRQGGPVEPSKPKQIYNQPQPAPQPYPAQPTATPAPQVPVYPAPQPAVATSIDTSPAVSAVGDKTCPRANFEPCISKELANERFRNCCQRLGDGCAQICSYDQTLANIQIAVLTGRCPIAKVADMMVCASGYEDATTCCQAYGVFEPGFEQCRPYCNPAAGLPNDGMLAEKYRCLGKMSQIQRCFYVSQRP